MEEQLNRMFDNEKIFKEKAQEDVFDEKKDGTNQKESNTFTENNNNTNSNSNEATISGNKLLSYWFSSWNTNMPSLKIPLEKNHLIVLVHGLHGSKNDFSNVATLLQEKYNNTFCFSSSCNDGILVTHDGIDLGGKRLADEVEKILNENPHLNEISFIAHSLGGLYSRYCIGELFQRSTFQKVKPKNFISLASPHLGVRRPPSSLYNSAFSLLVRTALSNTGKHLCLEDPAPHLLVELTMPSLPYFQGLSLFQKRILYCNIANDFQVSFSTAAILPKNPFKDEQKKINLSELKFMEKYPCILENPLPSSTPNIDEVYSRDERKIFLREMLKNLQQLSWERIAVFFNHLMAHESIIGKRYAQSLVVVHHLVDHFNP